MSILQMIDLMICIGLLGAAIGCIGWYAGFRYWQTAVLAAFVSTFLAWLWL